MKGSLAEIRPDRITVQLRNGQQNKDIIGTEADTFALEHDASDVSATNAMAGAVCLPLGKQRPEAALAEPTHAGTRPLAQAERSSTEGSTSSS